MVADLPQMALWVLIGFFIYKVIIIGSIYGVIRFVTTKLHDYLVTRKNKVKEIDIKGRIDDISLGNCTSQLLRLIYIYFQTSPREMKLDGQVAKHISAVLISNG